MSQPLPQALPKRLGTQVLRTLHLAVPVMLARLGLMIMIVVDSVMSGQHAGAALAHYGIALAPHVLLLVVGIGLMVATVVLVGQADGAGTPARCGAVWRGALGIGATMGTLAGLVMLSGPWLLRLMGQTPALAEGGGAALTGFAPGMPAILMYLATSFFLEGIGRPRVGMVVALAANLPNAALNLILIEGYLGAPVLGAAGASLATSITRWLMLGVLVAYVLRMPGRARYGIGTGTPTGPPPLRRMLRLGLPLALATGLEAGAFTTLATFAGWLGATPMAAYQTCINVVSFAFMTAIGMSTAASVRTANAVGRGDRPGLAAAGWLATGLSLALMLAIAGLVVWQRDLVAALYSDAADVQALARAGFLVVGPVIVLDGLQATLMGAHRGAADVAVPTALQAVSFWGVAIPLAYVLALHQGWGVVGLLTGLCIGLAAASGFLALRFAVVTRRPVRAVY